MATQFKITTTGTQDPVEIGDLGKVKFNHPTVDYDLLINFKIEELGESGDLKDLIDDGHIFAKDQFDNSILNPEHFENRSRNISVLFLGKDKPYSRTKQKEYTTLGCFIFPGTDKLGTIKNIKAVIAMQSGGTSIDVRLVDSSNGNVISEKTNNTNTRPQIIDMDGIVNVPNLESILELQMKTIKKEARCYSLNIEF